MIKAQSCCHVEYGRQSSKIKVMGAGRPFVLTSTESVNLSAQSGKIHCPSRELQILGTTMLKNLLRPLSCVHTCRQCKHLNLTVGHIVQNMSWIC